MDVITGNTRVNIKSDVSARGFADSFRQKVKTIHYAMSISPPSAYIANDVIPLFKFNSVTVDEVMKLIANAPYKQYQLDPIITWLLEKSSNMLSSFLSFQYKSLDSGNMPDIAKICCTTPFLKKANLDYNDTPNYCPVPFRICPSS